MKALCTMPDNKILETLKGENTMHFEVRDPESSLMVTEKQLGECGTHLDATREIN